MGDYLKAFEKHSEYETYSSGDMLKPNVSYCEDNNEVHYNPWTWADTYLTTVAREDGTISFNILSSMGTEYITSISYSKNNGETWTTTTNKDNKEANLVITVNVNTGDTILWKGTATQTGYYDDDDGDYYCSSFSSTANFDVQGNVMSLLYGDNFKGKVNLTGKNYVFCMLFNENTKVVSAEKLSLPATTLASGCYYRMFYGCTSLTTAPVLPATTLASGCYMDMFYGCTSLTTAPVLPVTTLAESCYDSMFRGCTSLTTAPVLPATTLASNCYQHMFKDCTSLTTAPSILPAATLVDECYNNMFSGCTLLATAPELPATVLANDCYGEMFSDCTKLNYIKAMFTTTPSPTYTSYWVSGVATTGTFVKNSAATWNVTGTNGIPTGWTVETASA